MTTKEIILSWLKHKTNLNKEFEFSSNDLQTQLPQFGLTYYRIPHTPDLYSREWRDMREHAERTYTHDGVWKIKIGKYTVQEMYKKGSKQLWYKVTRN